MSNRQRQIIYAFLLGTTITILIAIFYGFSWKSYFYTIGLMMLYTYIVQLPAVRKLYVGPIDDKKRSDAWQDYNNGLYKEAFLVWEYLAELNDAESQYRLGWLYERGEGRSQNYKKALKWYKKAVAQGEMDALTRIGHLYKNGFGISKNFEKAVDCFKVTAELGDAFAQYHLANMYVRGEGVNQSFKEAVKLYRKAAEQGHTESQETLAKFIGINSGDEYEAEKEE